jgi:hypothetical protein
MYSHCFVTKRYCVFTYQNNITPAAAKGVACAAGVKLLLFPSNYA